MGIVVCTLNTDQDEVLCCPLCSLAVALLPQLLMLMLSTSLEEPMDMVLLEEPMDLVLSEVSTLLAMPLPLQLSPLLLMLPQLPLMLMLPQLSTLLPLPLPPPQLSTMLDTRLTIMSSTFPRSLSRGTPPPTPPAMSSTMPQLSVLPSHTTLLSLLP